VGRDRSERVHSRYERDAMVRLENPDFSRRDFAGAVE